MLTSALAAVAVTCGSVAQFCYSRNRFVGDDGFCARTAAAANDILEKTTGYEQGGEMLFGLALPLTVIPILAYLLMNMRAWSAALSSSKVWASFPCFHKISTILTKRGETHIHVWSFLILAVPTFGICLDVLINTDARSEFEEGVPVWVIKLFMLANPFGVAACMALSFFLVPVARDTHNIWGWSPLHALIFHRWAGWFCAVYTMLHGVMFCIFYGFRTQDSNKLVGVWKALVPAKECWTVWSSPWAYRNYEFHHGHGGGGHGGGHTQTNACYGYFRNFCGLLSSLALLALCMTSWQWFRRSYYGAFYRTHIVAGTLMLIFAILHHPIISLYLIPSIVYYLAITMPTLIRHWISCYRDGGVKIMSVRQVPDSGGCVDLGLLLSSAENLSVSETPVYVRICVPELSAIWHPFSIMRQPGREQASILFRPMGTKRFTARLADRLLAEGPSPRIVVESFYEGAFKIPQVFFCHDTLLIVAGGVGIVPFVELFKAWRAKAGERLVASQRIVVCWTCREAGLVGHVLGEHLGFLFSGREDEREQSLDLPKIDIICHMTSRSTGDDDDGIIQIALPRSEREDEEQALEPSDSSSSDDSRTLTGKSIESSRSDAVSATIFAILLLCGWGLQVWNYTQRITQYLTVVIRADGLYVSFLVTILLGILGETILRQGWIRHESLRTTEESEHAHGATRRITSISSDPMVHRSDRVEVTVRALPGRPDLDRLAESVMAAEKPALLVCGPIGLRERAKKAVPESCAIYEEVSEM